MGTYPDMLLNECLVINTNILVIHEIGKMASKVVDSSYFNVKVHVSHAFSFVIDLSTSKKRP